MQNLLNYLWPWVTKGNRIENEPLEDLPIEPPPINPLLKAVVHGANNAGLESEGFNLRIQPETILGDLTEAEWFAKHGVTDIRTAREAGYKWWMGDRSAKPEEPKSEALYTEFTSCF